MEIQIRVMKFWVKLHHTLPATRNDKEEAEIIKAFRVNLALYRYLDFGKLAFRAERTMFPVAQAAWFVVLCHSDPGKLTHQPHHPRFWFEVKWLPCSGA